MSRFDFDNITLESAADITKVMGNFNKIEEKWQTYEVPNGAIIGFDGNTLPTGYEEVDNKQFQINDTNNTDFEIIIPHNGTNNIKHAFVMALQWCGVISVGNSTQTWVKKMANTDSVECTATQLENTSEYVKVRLTFTSTQYGGVEVICPYIN